MQISKVIHSLRPNTEWSMSGDDYENIIWHTEGVNPITKKEFEDETSRLQKIEDDEKLKTEQKKVIALAKLQALGLEESDLIALGFQSI